MTTLYAVVNSDPGYCRENPDTPNCAGVYTDPVTARTIATIVRGKVVEIELDFIHPGYFDIAKAFGYKL